MAAPTGHSKVVGGSTAKRLINCPGSRALVEKMPMKLSSSYADIGTLLHDVISQMLLTGYPAETFLGKKYGNAVLDLDLIDDKIVPAMAALDEIDPNGEMQFEVEVNVDFGDLLPGVFGSADIVARLGDTAIILDWKFGDGVAVEAEDNEQLLFYAAAAARTAAAQWAFLGAKDVELIIVQPPHVRRWRTTLERVLQFERDLTQAIKTSERADAPLALGEWCKWCAAKPVCPMMTGEVDRALRTKLKNIDAAALADALDRVDTIKEWVKSVEALAIYMQEEGVAVPRYKLVQKRATRKWADEKNIVAQLLGLGLTTKDVLVTEVVSPAQAEKKLKDKDIKLPAELVTAVSSGTTLAPESDSRPAVMQIGKQLQAALGKLK